MLKSSISTAKSVLTKKIGKTGISAADIESMRRKEAGLTVDDAVARGMWLALPKTARNLVNEVYTQKSGGKTIMEARDFRAGILLAPIIVGAYK